MSKLTILHNPRCSKSRQTLALLTDKGLQPTVVDYLKTPLTLTELNNIISLLGFTSARQLLRKGEPIYKEQQLANSQLTETQLLTAMLTYPKLIERPIVLNADKAAIGRPPEAVLTIL
jgi:arsenate reductase